MEKFGGSGDEFVCEVGVGGEEFMKFFEVFFNVVLIIEDGVDVS